MTNLSGANLNNGAAVGPQGEGRESPSSFPKYPVYKDSGVEWLGVVPEHWGVSPLKWLVEQVTDKATTSDFQVGLENIEGWTGRFIETDTEFAGDGIAFRQEDILFGKLRPYLAKVWLAGRSGQAVGDFFVLRPRTVNSEFLHKYILTPTVIEDLNASTIGAKMPRVGWEDMAALAVTLPSHKEQTQIARFLDHETARIDALIEEQQRLIELLKEKRQAVISHAVTKGLDPTVPMKDSGVEWLGEVPAHWHVGALKHFISPVPGAIKTGPFGSHLKSEDMKEGPYKVFNQRSVIDADFSAGDNFISEEKFGELRGFTAFPGDVLVTTRGTIGRAAILPDNAEVGILHPCLLRIQVEKSKITSSYLCRLIQESHLLKTQLSLLSNSTTIEVIYSETMANLFIPVPPITEQGQIAGFLDDVIRKFGALTSDANESVRLLQERRSALISAAVTGKIDVRGWQPPASAPTPELAQEAV